MLHLALTLAIAFAVIGVNSCAIYAGKGVRGWLQTSATASGIAGLFFVILVPISLLYALGNYFLDPAQDTSPIFFAAIGGTGISTVASLFFCIAIWRHRSRSGA